MNLFLYIPFQFPSGEGKKKKREREGYDLGVNVKEGFCLCGELVQRRGCNVFYGNGESATGLVLRVES